ncbi:receptor-like protein kinase FERONIA [Prosopis cineraria]|uniref:receptor-like protein kinase FERONIA n=1 Tax=Prosopis cineraria TaxID=364024 RepID=UPI00240EFB5D|nr:receptor-like protein kinase FERONIA [Prosopis cineraria]
MTLIRRTITAFFLSLSLFCLSILVVVDSYDPVDIFSINCGSRGNSSLGNRTWIGDIDSKLLSSSQDKSSPATAINQSPSTIQVPYTTARLSRSKFTYSFPVTPGQKFVRLFFYPTSYPGFDSSNGFFTVESGGFTLLKDFNASLNALAEGSDTLLREYCVNVDDAGRLNLTFSPNSTNPDYYAFINGIEIVSMPTDLYYTESDGQGVPFVGRSGSFFTIGNNSALEKEYRLNVGGKAISSDYDTGMLRSWEPDDSFVKSPSYLPVQILPVNLTYSIEPDYTAPVDVYLTARDMGKNATWNKLNNLTWEFSVDSGFTYMVRLHFCELDPNITSSSDRAFFIYIAGQVAEDNADILKWGKQKGVPVHRDYVVSVRGNQKKEKLLLQMHPLPDSKTVYSDPILNGLEIFKISDPASNNLAGPNPDLPPLPLTPPTSVQKSKKSSSNTTTIVGVVVGVVAGIILLFIIGAFFLIRRGKRIKDSKSSDAGSKWGPLSHSTAKSTTTTASTLPSDLCRYFSIAEIRAATNNFDEVFIIGIGGFGNVYKGYIDDSTIPVAIKRLKPDSQQGAHEFKTEIEMLSQLRHLHLVSLIGYCNENNEMILVYDFMARGTLRDHLYNSENPPLTWKQRLQICIGAAKGLHYLHSGARYTIIHRDVKSTNILLDEKWVAKVSDFGLSRIGPTGMSKAHVSTVVKGSMGYLDPEYYKRQRLTEKSDVYSFGVVLFEILCARPALIRTTEKKQVSLADWGKHCYQMGSLDQIVDPDLIGKISPECLRKFGEIAASCLLDDGTQRPSMNDVVWGLEFALQLQENAEQQTNESEREEVGGGGKSSEGSHDDLFSSSSGMSVGAFPEFNKGFSGVSMMTSSGGRSYGTKETDSLMTVNIFSEIGDPKAR